MKKFLAMCLSVAIVMSTLVFTLPASAEELTVDEQLALKAAQLEADMATFTETVPTVEYHSNYDVGNIKAITYSGASIDGAPTKAFAYIGYPENMEEGKKYPAVVLVHGGGGHAFPKWVQKWNDNGYIAIAMDNTGHFPDASGNWVWGLSNSPFAETGYGNAPNNDSYNNIAGDLDNQWMYHAVAQVILAKGVLEADAAVDADKIGIYGISWGSIITNTTIGFEKFAFAVSQYVASNFELAQAFCAPFALRKGYKELWKADSRYNRVDFPVLFEQYTYDFSSSIRATSKCYEDLMGAGSVMSLRTNWVHTHDWDTPIEAYRFADSITSGGKPLTTFATQPDNSGNINCTLNVPDDADNVTARVQYISEKLTYTESGTPSPNQCFKTAELSVNNGVITGKVPNEAVEFYVEVTTEIDGETYYTASIFQAVDKYYNITLDSESETDIVADFENGENPFPVIDNVYSNNVHYSTDSQYISVSSEEALNGETSLKVNVPAGNSRTEVVLAEPALNSSNKPVNKYIASASDASGIMLRLKINNDTSAVDHKFSIWLGQSGVKNYTFLAKGAVLYDLEGNAQVTSSGARNCVVPSNFDGFVYLPFATAHTSCDCNLNQVYDNYVENPECMVDYTKNYNIAIVLGYAGDDSSWDNTQVLIDDVCVVGAGENAVLNAMNACGYNTSTSVPSITQPEKYTLPITSENLWNPLGNVTAFLTDNTNIETDNVKYTSATTLTNKVIEVLNGKLSMKIDFNLSDYTSKDTVVHKIRTDFFTVEGVEGLSPDNIKTAASNDYAYFKVRISVPSDGNTYNFWTFIKQAGASLCAFHADGFAYNSNGTKNTSVVFNNNSPIQIPAGFDGYLYLPVYKLREMVNEIYPKYRSVYINPEYETSAPDLSKDFQIAFELKNNNTDLYDATTDSLNDVTIYIDDIDFVFGGGDGGELPFTFDGDFDTMPQAAQYKSGHYNFLNITKVYGEEALNGNASIKVDILGDAQNNYYYNAVCFNGLDGVAADSGVSGVMLRIKLINDNTAGIGNQAHQMNIAFGQSGNDDDLLLASKAKLYDINGRPLDSSRYAANYTNLFVPIGFDGYIFFPIDESARVKQLGTKALIDITQTFNLKLWFVYTANWEGVDALIDDVSYYSVADSTAGLTTADAVNAINSCGYDARWQEQSATYDLPVNLENGIFPFYNIISYYGQLNGDGVYPQAYAQTELLTGENALSGDVSYKYTISRVPGFENAGRSYVRADSNISNFNGIKGLDKETIAANSSDYAYIKLRIKVPSTNANGYEFNLYATQTGVSYTTRLRASHGITVDGEYVAMTSKDGVTILPAGFDGTIYMPIKNSTAYYILPSGGRPSYGGEYVQSNGSVLYGNDYMVDFSKEFKLQLYLQGNAWADTVLEIDDMALEINYNTDFNGDGSVDVKDIIILKRFLLGTNTESNAAFDLNLDGEVDIRDLIKLKNLMASV